MFERLIKNPVILAVVAGIIVYIYMAWNKKQEDNKRLKKGKKIKQENKYNNIIIPGVTAILVWFITYGYFNNNNKLNDLSNPNPNVLNNVLNNLSNQNVLNNQYRVVRDNLSESDAKQSFTLVNKSGGVSLQNIHNLPSLPDMF